MITNHQKRKIKELVDEIIVNRGILTVSRRNYNIDGMDSDDLYRLAFRYYGMIMKGESPLDIDSSNQQMTSDTSTEVNSPPDNCIGCNKPLSEEEVILKIPVCKSCRSKVKVDYEVLRELFH